MTNQEINEQVARKLGWKECNCEPQYRQEHIAYMPAKHRMPNYCGSIEAAWEIVEHLNSKQIMVSMNQLKECQIQISQHHLNNVLSESWAPTAPMAICLAFLEELK